MMAFWGITAVLVLTAFSMLLIPLIRWKQCGAQRVLLTLVVLGLPTVVWTMYQYVGAGPEVNAWASAQENKKQIAFYRQHPEKMIAGLKQRLRADPNSVKGWDLLGRIQFDLHHFHESVNAFKKAHALDPSNINIQFAYAQALFFAEDRQLHERSAELIDAVLKAKPNHLQALNLRALNAYLQQDFTAALADWRKLLPFYPEKTQEGRLLRAAIAKTQQALGDEQKEAQSTGLKVRVFLSDALRDRVEPNDIVLIYAIHAEGPRMPLAIIRERVRHLPITIELSDANAMFPQMRLSQAKRVQVIARVSKNGQAFAREGDLEGRSQVIAVARQDTVKIVINTVH